MAETQEIDLASLLQFSIALAREAGELISQGSDAILSSEAEEVEDKKNSVDLVTKYDKAVEALVNKKINMAYPTYKLQVVFEPSLWIKRTTCLRDCSLFLALGKKERLPRERFQTLPTNQPSVLIPLVGLYFSNYNVIFLCPYILL